MVWSGVSTVAGAPSCTVSLPRTETDCGSAAMRQARDIARKHRQYRIDFIVPKE